MTRKIAWVGKSPGLRKLKKKKKKDTFHLFHFPKYIWFNKKEDLMKDIIWWSLVLAVFSFFYLLAFSAKHDIPTDTMKQSMLGNLTRAGDTVINSFEKTAANHQTLFLYLFPLLVIAFVVILIYDFISQRVDKDIWNFFKNFKTDTLGIKIRRKKK